MGFNCLISYKYKFLLFWNPKCGCSTIKYIFAKLHNINVSNDDLHKYFNCKNCPFSLSLKEYLKQKEKFIKFKKIIVVRSPYDRLFSFYKNKLVQNDNNYPTYLDKNKKINASNYSINDLINKLKNIPNNDLEYHLEKQSTNLEDINFDKIIKLENLFSLYKYFQSLSIPISGSWFIKLNSFSGKTLELKDISYNNLSVYQWRLKISFPKFENILKPEHYTILNKIYYTDFEKFNYSML